MGKLIRKNGDGTSSISNWLLTTLLSALLVLLGAVGGGGVVLGKYQQRVDTNTAAIEQMAPTLARVDKNVVKLAATLDVPLD